MTVYELPEALEVDGRTWPIRSDFRDVLYILQVMARPELESDEKNAVCLRVLYPDWAQIPPESWPRALERAAWFIDGGLPELARREKDRPRLMDWGQDGPLLLPAVNRVLGREVRAEAYVHWWTFLGAYMEIGESLFSTVLGLRAKRAKGKRLEKYEQEFYRDNRALVDLRREDTESGRARREALRELFV